jgi:hypothetical protein
MQTSLAEWIMTDATCVLAAGGIGAFIYAARTYGAQSRQLKIAKADSARLRTPVLRGELPGSAATWQMAVRAGAPQRRPSMSGADDGPQIRLSAECTPAGGGDGWRVEVPVTHGRDVTRSLGGPARIRVID